MNARISLPLAAIEDDDRRALNPEIVEQAIQWKVKLLPKSGDQYLIAALLRWLQTHPDHLLAWSRIERLGQELDAGLAAAPQRELALTVLEQGALGMQRRKFLKQLSIVAACGSASWLAYQTQPWSADYRTGVGERREFVLADGSRLSLNTGSAVDLRFSETERLLVLRQGELLLDSGTDPAFAGQRPLRVRTRQALLEAIGTRFLIRQEDTRCLLQVAEGRVAMLHTNGARQIAEAGETFSIEAGIYQQDAASLDLDGWTRGVLVIRDMRLRDFLVELSRYRSGYLACADSVADLRLSGVFQLDQPDNLLQLLPELLPVTVVSRSRWWIHVQALA